MGKVTFSVIGLGGRGKDAYLPALRKFSDKASIVAVADIDREKRRVVQNLYQVPDHLCFERAEDLLAQKKLSDVLIIATQDKLHFQHAIPALEAGYDLIIEKPISPDLKECAEIEKLARTRNRKVVVCHVLRYTTFFKQLKEILDQGVIGEIVSINAVENVGYWHQAHSFVRGNWRNSKESSPMILAKSCHDLDLYLWLSKKKSKHVSSFGSTFLFRSEKAPQGAAKRCLAGCQAKADCPYDAEKIYMTNTSTGIKHGNTDWPNRILALSPTEDKIYAVIKEGPYGRCVYHCDNDVVDHQVVNVEMEDGATLSFTMSAFTDKKSRYAQLMGTMGEIYADMSENKIEVIPFYDSPYTIDISKLSSNSSGHGGGDEQLIKEFIDYQLTGQSTESITTITDSVESHYLALAAEASRLAQGQAISMAAFIKQYE